MQTNVCADDLDHCPVLSIFGHSASKPEHSGGSTLFPASPAKQNNVNVSPLCLLSFQSLFRFLFPFLLGFTNSKLVRVIIKA